MNKRKFLIIMIVLVVLILVGLFLFTNYSKYIHIKKTNNQNTNNNENQSLNRIKKNQTILNYTFDYNNSYEKYLLDTKEKFNNNSYENLIRIERVEPIIRNNGSRVYATIYYSPNENKFNNSIIIKFYKKIINTFVSNGISQIELIINQQKYLNKTVALYDIFFNSKYLLSQPHVIPSNITLTNVSVIMKDLRDEKTILNQDSKLIGCSAQLLKLNNKSKFIFNCTSLPYLIDNYTINNLKQICYIATRGKPYTIMINYITKNNEKKIYLKNMNEKKNYNVPYFYYDEFQRLRSKIINLKLGFNEK